MSNEGVDGLPKGHSEPLEAWTIRAGDSVLEADCTTSVPGEQEHYAAEYALDRRPDPEGKFAVSQTWLQAVECGAYRSKRRRTTGSAQDKLSAEWRRRRRKTRRASRALQKERRMHAVTGSTAFAGVDSLGFSW